MSVIYHLIGNTIVVHVGGRTHSISSDDKRFDLICALITKNQVETIAHIVDQEASYFKVLARITESLAG